MIYTIQFIMMIHLRSLPINSVHHIHICMIEIQRSSHEQQG